MFFIMGMNTRQVKLNFSQLEVCRCCGKYGRIEVFMTYMCLSIFFLPILKWGKRYYVRMDCCDSVTEISKEVGRGIEKGTITEIPYGELSFGTREDSMKHCSYCGYTTEEDFDFCPKCGKEF